MTRSTIGRICCTVWLLSAGIARPALAESTDLGGGLTFDHKLTLNYALAMRTEKPSNELINGPIDSLKVIPADPNQTTTFPILVINTGLPTTINSDDADRNFNQWKLIHNRISALLETQFTWRNYGAVASADGFYDQVYNQPNDNNADALVTAQQPSTSNKFGPSNEFTEGTRYYDGRRIRLLDGYLYGDWMLGSDMSLDLRVGKQLAAWGESLFFSGIASAQAPADATKAFVPGAEVKEILLPVNQISTSLAIGTNWTLLGQYKLDYKPNEIFPLGDFLSTTDVVGPGTSFAAGALNPLYPLNGKFGIQAPDAYIHIYHRPDDLPSNFGQYGLGLRYQATLDTTLGLYWLRYHDTNPSVVQNVGYNQAGTLTIGGNTYVLTTHIPGIIDEVAPNSMTVKYFDGIDLAGLSFSTNLFGANVAGELNYRQNAAIPVAAIAQGVVDPIFVRGRLTQALLSAIYVMNPHVFFDDLQIVGETGFLHVNGVHAAAPVYSNDPAVSRIPGLVPVGNGQTLLYSRNAWGFESLVIPTKHDVVQGWDLSLPINFGGIPTGNPSMPGAFGAYAGGGDYRLSIGANLQYLNNLQFGLSYNMFYGSASKNIGSSSLKQNPYVDRDYISLNVKYSL